MSRMIRCPANLISLVPDPDYGQRPQRIRWIDRLGVPRDVLATAVQDRWLETGTWWEVAGRLMYRRDETNSWVASGWAGTKKLEAPEVRRWDPWMRPDNRHFYFQQILTPDGWRTYFLDGGQGWVDGEIFYTPGVAPNATGPRQHLAELHHPKYFDEAFWVLNEEGIWRLSNRGQYFQVTGTVPGSGIVDWAPAFDHAYALDFTNKRVLRIPYRTATTWRIQIGEYAEGVVAPTNSLKWYSDSPRQFGIPLYDVLDALGLEYKLVYANQGGDLTITTHSNRKIKARYYQTQDGVPYVNDQWLQHYLGNANYPNWRFDWDEYSLTLRITLEKLQ